MLLEDLIPGINIEDDKTEFKRFLEEGKSEDSDKNKEIGWLKSFVAFANTDSATVYIGVDNKSHNIISMDHETADKQVLLIHRQIKQRLEPAVSYKIESIPVKEKEITRYILKVSIAKSQILPVMLHEDNLLGIYVRNYGNSVLATPEQIRDLVLLSDNNPFDQPFTQKKFLREEFKKLFDLYNERVGNPLTEKA